MKDEEVYDTKLEKTVKYTIGENAQENWNLIDKSENHFIWFHIANNPSSHVVIKIEKKDIININKSTLLHCASRCKMHSKLKNNKNVNVIYTQIINIKKGIDVGSVITTKCKYLIV
jgi:predicted ribosome quality control (RQC) complex YloA/Tae2 family protein